MLLNIGVSVVFAEGVLLNMVSRSFAGERTPLANTLLFV
jgi:hypothetical protein